MDENIAKSKIFQTKLIQKINNLGLYCFESDVLELVGDYVGQVEEDKSSAYKNIERGFQSENMELKVDAISMAKRNIVGLFLLILFLEFGPKRGRACMQN